MPVSGKEEPGVIARQSSNISAGVPIKKRRFPVVRPSSPPLNKSSAVPAENDFIENKHSSPSQESSVLNATGSPGKSDASKNSISAVKKEVSVNTNCNLVGNSDNLSCTKPQESSPIFHSDYLDNVYLKEKLMLTGKHLHQKIPGNTELHLAPNEALAGVGKELVCKQQIGRDCKPEPFTIAGHVELSLGAKEPLVPASAAQNSEGCHQMPDKLDPSSLSLSLSKEKFTGQCNSGYVNANNDSNHVPANRSNWDLNTTMDAWEGTVGDAPLLDTVGFDGLNKTGGSHDVKPLITSTGVLGVKFDTGKQILEASDQRSNFPLSSFPPRQKSRVEDPLHLSLSPSFCRSNFSEHSGSSAKVDSGRAVPDSNMLGPLVSTENTTSAGRMNVKSEPFDENAKHDCGEAKGKSKGLPAFRKKELVQGCSKQDFKLSGISPSKIVEHRSVKSEPVQESNQQTHRTTEVISHRIASSTIEAALTPQKLCSLGLPNCSELSVSGDVSNQSEYSTSTKEVSINRDAPQKACGNVENIAAETVSTSVGYETKESNAFDGMKHFCRAEDSNVDDPETCRMEVMDGLPHSRGNGEGSESDQEKINISADDMLEEDFYGSDCESDGNRALVTPKDTEDRQDVREDDEYEDGEVREPLVRTAVEDPIEEREAKNVNLADCDNRNLDSLGFPVDGNTAQAPIDEKDSWREDHGEASNDHIKVCVDAVLNENADQVVDKGISLQESLSVEVAAARAEEEIALKATQRRLHDQLARSDVQKGDDTELSFDEGTNGEGTEATFGQVADEDIKGIDFGEKDDSTLPKIDASLNEKDGAKDASSSGSRSRIINLPRASNATSPSKTRPIPDRSFVPGPGRERYADFEEEKFQLRRNRDEFYNDGPRKFVRERFQDQSLRNSRFNFGRGRGRVSNRLDHRRGEWVSDRNFPQEIYNGPADYRFSRQKRGSAVGDAELESNGYVMTPDGTRVGSGRGGRKPLNDELPSFRNPSSRRLSPGGGRDGPATRDIQMVRRITTRNISPSRCTGEDGSDLVEPGHGEKFMRGLPDDIIDPIFTRPQHPYDGLDGQFVRRNRNFSSVQRRGGLSRIRSKSPIRSRTRSPGPWSSPRRRSPDGFNGHPELPLRRSPAMYRMERIRSPDCFTEEMVPRRRGSPPYMARPSNDMRDMDSGRVHGPPRSIVPNRRSPSDRVLPRKNRQFDNLDPRERTDSGEYFGGPMRGGRFHELGGDGSGDERRKSGERRGGIVRSFRPPFNGADDDNNNFRFHIEDGPRPFRFCPEADSDFIERSNLREREFDRRIKNRPVITPRRMRGGIEEQEGNYRQGGQVWHDDGFDDATRGKRRRF